VPNYKKGVLTGSFFLFLSLLKTICTKRVDIIAYV